MTYPASYTFVSWREIRALFLNLILNAAYAARSISISSSMI